jgi:hypothetical protein
MYLNIDGSAALKNALRRISLYSRASAGPAVGAKTAYIERGSAANLRH